MGLKTNNMAAPFKQVYIVNYCVRCVNRPGMLAADAGLSLAVLAWPQIVSWPPTESLQLHVPGW